MYVNRTEIHVIEAYGRSYNELHEARTAWHNNLDFRVVAVFPPLRSGRHINRSDVAPRRVRGMAVHVCRRRL